MAKAADDARRRWLAGRGPITHTAATRRRVSSLARRYGPDWTYAVLAAADRLTSAAMWVVAHMTYAERVDLSGAPLPAEAFKANPQGHTGGSLNVVPAYVGYLAANVLSATTRGWLLGQGHCVAAIEAVNALVGNLSPAQEGRYGPTQAGLSNLARDFYSYEIGPDGRPVRPLGSHLTPFTGGAVSEGGYLGFAEIQYVHMPLPGESLVAILSDGAFEEQRGGDWSERWWRAADCGLVAPMMVLNGRRIEQRTEIAQDGGAAWLGRHLRANGFDPFEIDGRDPAAYAWAILECEARLDAAAEGIAAGRAAYPVRLPYVIASTIKGFGFPGAGTLAAHNLPLPGVPCDDVKARRLFNEGAAGLFVPEAELAEARRVFDIHASQGRPRERDNVFTRRCPPTPVLPPTPDLASAEAMSPMAAIDRWFVDLVEANPGLRIRIGNPDELRSNQMGRTLERLKHRVNRPEPGAPEALDGAVVTALNEEAVAGAALGNKAGLNLIVSYEAFAVKMLGVLRQEIIFARQQKEAGVETGWLGVPLIVTSHTWENGKNQQSHQDPTLPEALLGEMADVSRVFFPIDGATAVECLKSVYRDRGVIGCVVAPKSAMPLRLSAAQAARALAEGYADLVAHDDPAIQLISVGAHQAQECVRAAARLAKAGVATRVTAILEPGRLRAPRDAHEGQVTLTDDQLRRGFPRRLPRILSAHARPDPLLGLLRRIDEGPERMRAHGYLNRGGTLDPFGMLFANRCTWAHLLGSAASLLRREAGAFLAADEAAAVLGQGDPNVLR